MVYDQKIILINLGLKEAGFITMTEIQQVSIPQALQKNDILAAAKTGSGKTLAYIVPVFPFAYFLLFFFQVSCLSSQHPSPDV